MQITLEADYAVRMTYILAQTKKRLSAENLAEQGGLTVRFALKILQKLVGAGLVKSFKGVGGGYEIAKQPKEISLYDIVMVIDGPVHIARCVRGDYECTREKEGVCPFQCAFEEVSKSVREQLAAKTLDQFATEE